MESFLEWVVRCGKFCDYCEEVKYVGGYKHGPMYEKVYSWPHSVSPYSYLPIDALQGKYYCWKCFYKMQEATENRLIMEYRSTHPESKGTFLQWLRRMSDCSECGRLIPERVGYQINKGPYDSNVYCLHCVEKVAERQFIVCQDCGKKTASSTNGYCYDCYPIYRAYEAQVSNHLGRARAAGTPATLTIQQWVATLTYFHEKCAYCQSRPSQVVEHFLPISLGGGTTADNCVPACHSCNSKKGSVHPDRLSIVFPAHAIERVKKYLQSEKQENTPRITSGRELVVLEKFGKHTK